MAFLTSQPISPLPWGRLLGSMATLWLAPTALGLMCLVLFVIPGQVDASLLSSDRALQVWALGYALLLSPLFSWIGWVLALPALALALNRGWFGWASALLIGAAAGAVAGRVTDIELAPPFGILALLSLRAILGRLLPL